MDHLTRLTGTVMLLQSHKISAIAAMNDEVFMRQLEKLTSDTDRQARCLYALVVYMYQMEVEAFENLLSQAEAAWGIETVIDNIIIPLLEKTGITSYNDSSSEVHFTVTAVRKKLVLAIEGIRVNPGKTSALLFLPEGEHYDLMLLYMTYVLRRQGINTLYLGTNITIANLQKVVALKKPGLLCTYISAGQRPQLNKILHYIAAEANHSQLYIVSDAEKMESAHTLRQFRFIHYRQFYRGVEG